jgi:hypothetical protein
MNLRHLRNELYYQKRGTVRKVEYIPNVILNTFGLSTTAIISDHVEPHGIKGIPQYLA